MKHIIILQLLLLSCLSLGAVDGRKDISYDCRPQDVPAKDTLSVLCIGNSFTYYFDTYNILQEIAASQGHCLKIRAAYVGGYSLSRHLVDQNTIGAVEKYDAYDVAFLQNQSSFNAYYGRDPKRFREMALDCVELAGRVRAFSPGARIFFEATWASPRNSSDFTDFDEFDNYMWKGTVAIAKKSKAGVSPIGRAFAGIRREHPEIALILKDRLHQTMSGAYLKSCVNYLMIFGGDFDGKVSDCGLPAEEAGILRTAALEAVEKSR